MVELSWGLGVQDGGLGKFNNSVQVLPVPFLPKILTSSSPIKVQ